MQYTTEKLTQTHSYSDFKGDNDFKVCGAELRELFDLPKEVREIWLTASDKEIKHSMPYEIDSENCRVELTLLDGSHYRRYLYTSFKKRAREHLLEGHFIVQYKEEE